jgi:hypothetical protein
VIQIIVQSGAIERIRKWKSRIYRHRTQVAGTSHVVNEATTVVADVVNGRRAQVTGFRRVSILGVSLGPRSLR